MFTTPGSRLRYVRPTCSSSPTGATQPGHEETAFAGHRVGCWRVAILSPTDRPAEVQRKRDDCFASGVPSPWVVEHGRARRSRPRSAGSRHTAVRSRRRGDGAGAILPGLEPPVHKGFEWASEGGVAQDRIRLRDAPGRVHRRARRRGGLDRHGFCTWTSRPLARSGDHTYAAFAAGPSRPPAPRPGHRFMRRSGPWGSRRTLRQSVYPDRCTHPSSSGCTVDRASAPRRRGCTDIWLFGGALAVSQPRRVGFRSTPSRSRRCRSSNWG